MPRRIPRYLRLHTFEVAILALYMAVVVFTVVSINDTRSREDAHFQQQINANRQSICLFFRLFGLDQPLAEKQLQGLRPIQREALRELVASCQPKKGATH